MKKISNLGNLCKSSKIVPNHLKWYYFNFFSTFNYLKLIFSPFLGQKLPFLDFFNRFFNSNFQNICSKLIIFLINHSTQIYLSVQNKKIVFHKQKINFCEKYKNSKFWVLTNYTVYHFTDGLPKQFWPFPSAFQFFLCLTSTRKIVGRRQNVPVTSVSLCI